MAESDFLHRALRVGPAEIPPYVFALQERPGKAGLALRFAGLRRDGASLAVEGSDAIDLAPETLQPVTLGAFLRDPAAFGRQLSVLLSRAGGAAKVEEASLLLPESWLRLVFAEASDDLPRAAPARQEVLLFKLRRLVPFRVEELRVEAVEVLAMPGQEEPRRLLVAFAAEAVLASFEDAFAAQGIRLGLITNPSLALFAGVRRAARAPGLSALLVATGDESTLLVAREDQPILHRHRVWSGELDDGARRDLAVRDLKLVAAFLADKLPGEELREVLVLAPPALAADWRAWLAAGLGRPAVELAPHHLPLAVATLPAPWQDTAALLGAASIEVA